MSQVDQAALEAEVVQLFALVRKLREDLSSVYFSGGENQVLDTAADQLAEIVEEQETATDSILGAAERIQSSAGQLKKEIKYSGARPVIATMEVDSNAIIEACQVHDIIRERVAKIVRTINLVEGTLNSLVVTVGSTGVAGLPTAISGINMMDGELELEGPAVKNEGLKQSDVDAIFETAPAE